MAADLEIRIGAELSEIKSALSQLNRDLGKIGRNEAGASKPLSGLEGALQRATTMARGLVAAVAGLAAAKGLVDMADQVKNLDARLRLATNSAEEFARAQTALFEMAQRTRTPLSETVSLYSQISNATKDAGVGQETLLGIVETINQAVQLSGTSAEAASAALMQLGQGLGSGTLRGEELNSVLEQTPRLADAIAKGMGITRGELRKYGEEGKITAEQVIKALQAQRDAVAGEFAQLPTTVGQATTQVMNAFMKLVGVFDETSGATGGLAGVISDFATFLSSDAVLDAVMAFAQTAREAFELVRDIVTSAVVEIIGALQAIAGVFDVVQSQIADAIAFITDDLVQLPRTAGESVDLIVKAFRDLPTNLKALVKLATIFVAEQFDYLISEAQAFVEQVQAIFTDDTIDEANRRAVARANAIKQAAEETRAEILAERDATIAARDAARAAAEETRRLARRRTNATGLGNFKPPKKDEKGAADAGDRADAEAKLLKDATERALREVERLYDGAELSLEAYLRRRTELQVDAIDKEIALERKKAAAGSGKDRLKAETEITLLERRKTDILTQAEADRKKITEANESDLLDLRIRQLEASGKVEEAARLKSEQQFKELRKRLAAEGNAAGVDLVDSIVRTDVLEARLQELGTKVSSTIADLRSRESLIAQQVEAGQITALQGEQQLKAARAESVAQLEQYRAALQAAYDPNAANAQELLLQIRAVDAEILRVKNTTKSLQAQLAQAGTDAVTTLFEDLASGSKSAGDAIKDFARNFAASMAQVAARALATYAVLQLMDAIYPGLGRMVAATGGATAGVNHRGGMVGSGHPRRVDPMLFAGAPRFHSGGIVGLKSDERPAILQTGEEVLARNDPRNAANGGGGGSGTRVVNVIDPSITRDYMESADGERVILNVIGRNPGQVKQLIGT